MGRLQRKKTRGDGKISDFEEEAVVNASTFETGVSVPAADELQR